MNGIMNNPKLEATYNELIKLNDFTRFWEFFRTNSNIMRTDSAVDYLVARLKVDCLVGTSDDGTLMRRMNTVMMLSAIGSQAQRGVPLLQEIIKNKSDDRLLRSICIEAIKKIESDSIDKIHNVVEEKRIMVKADDIQSSLVTSLQSSLTKPIDGLKTHMHVLSYILGDERERGQSASKIGRMGSEAMEAVPLLIKIVNSDFESKALRYLCIQSIKKIAPVDKETILTLVKILLNKDEAPFVRRACAYAIAEIKPTNDGVVKGLVHLLENMDDNIYIRRACLDALAEMKESSREVLKELKRLAKSRNFDLSDVVRKSINQIEKSIGENILDQINKPITGKTRAPEKKKIQAKKSKSTKSKTKPVKKTRTTVKVKAAATKKTKKKYASRTKSK